MQIVTLTTDFGTADAYPAAMKGVILAINPNVKLVDISHSIRPQNILQGAFILYSVAQFFPHSPRTIHVAVVDPGVGTDRAGLIIACRAGVFIGPDNGLLVPASECLGIDKVVRISNLELCRDNISTTFHGRDIFAPAAAHLSKGVPVEEFGEKVEKYIKLNLFDVKEKADVISGTILNIDNFGNIITNISKEIVDKHFSINDMLSFSFTLGDPARDRGALQVPYKPTYGDLPKGAMLATISSSGFLEIAGNQCGASEILNVQISDSVSLKKKG